MTHTASRSGLFIWRYSWRARALSQYSSPANPPSTQRGRSGFRSRASTPETACRPILDPIRLTSASEWAMATELSTQGHRDHARRPAQRSERHLSESRPRPPVPRIGLDCRPEVICRNAWPAGATGTEGRRSLKPRILASRGRPNGRSFSFYGGHGPLIVSVVVGTDPRAIVVMPSHQRLRDRNYPKGVFQAMSRGLSTELLLLPGCLVGVAADCFEDVAAYREGCRHEQNHLAAEQWPSVRGQDDLVVPRTTLIDLPHSHACDSHVSV